MSMDLSYEIWNELKRYISTVERDEAADVLVNLLIDNDYDAENIKSVFKNDSDIKRALKEYLKDHEEEEEDDDLEEEEEDDYDDSY
jgi:hypothetical protein